MILLFFSDITSFAYGVYLNIHQIFIKPHDMEFADRLWNTISGFALFYGCGDFISSIGYIAQ